MVELNEQLKEVLDSTLSTLETSLDEKNCKIFGLIDFELAVINVGSMKGGFKLILAEANGKYDEKRVSKIKFSVLGKDVNQFSRVMWKPKSLQKIL